MSKSDQDPLGSGQFDEFLRFLLVDSEGGGKHQDDSSPNGFVTWRPLRMDPEDYHICGWDDDRPHPFSLDWDEHGAAYAVSMEALLRLRHWWSECSDHYGGERAPAAAVLESMAADIDCVCGFLSSVRDVLKDLAAKDTEVQLKTAKEDFEYKERALRLAGRALAGAEAKHELASILTMTPTEILARQSDTSDTTPDHEE
jgi:hypothetical protein